MKITIEQLDFGYLVEAIDERTQERLALPGPKEVLDAVSRGLGIPLAPEVAPRQTRTPIAPSPEPRYSAEDDPDIPAPPERESAPPATRRIGLSQPSKSRPPVGRRGA